VWRGFRQFQFDALHHRRRRDDENHQQHPGQISNGVMLISDTAP
jgi:hypothetical protein